MNPNLDVTALLTDETMDAGQRSERLLSIVYKQLRATAERLMASERRDHTLQATALVHEAFMRLVGDRQIPWANQAHFYAAAAEAMRRVLLDHAKSRGRLKRGGGRAKLSLDISGVADLAHTENPESIVALDRAFDRLEGESPDVAAVVRLRFYAGLTVSQTARALDLSPRTVDRHWAYARAWMLREIKRAKDAEDDLGNGG